MPDEKFHARLLGGPYDGLERQLSVLPGTVVVGVRPGDELANARVADYCDNPPPWPPACGIAVYMLVQRVGRSATYRWQKLRYDRLMPPRAAKA